MYLLSKRHINTSTNYLSKKIARNDRTYNNTTVMTPSTRTWCKSSEVAWEQNFYTLRAKVRYLVACWTTFSSTGRPLRLLTASISFLAVFCSTLAPSPNSSSFSSVLGTKNGSSGSISQWLKTSRALDAPDVHLLSWSAKPKLSQQGHMHAQWRVAILPAFLPWSLWLASEQVLHTWSPDAQLEYSIHRSIMLQQAWVFSEVQLLCKLP